MLNDPGLKKIIVRVVVASFALTLLVAAPYIARRLSKSDGEKKPGSKVIRYGTKRFSWNNAKGEDDQSSNTEISTTQLKPSFGNLPNELFPGNRPFSLDFHKLPMDYMTPQQPEVTRTVLRKIKQFQVAELAAIAAQQTMAKNYERSQPNDGTSNE